MCIDNFITLKNVTICQDAIVKDVLTVVCDIWGPSDTAPALILGELNE